VRERAAVAAVSLGGGRARGAAGGVEGGVEKMSTPLGERGIWSVLKAEGYLCLIRPRKTSKGSSHQGVLLLGPNKDKRRHCQRLKSGGERSARGRSYGLDEFFGGFLHVEEVIRVERPEIRFTLEGPEKPEKEIDGVLFLLIGESVVVVTLHRSPKVF